MRDVASLFNRRVPQEHETSVTGTLLDKTHAIWILQGRLFVHKAYLGEMKRELHLRFIR